MPLGHRAGAGEDCQTPGRKKSRRVAVKSPSRGTSPSPSFPLLAGGASERGHSAGHHRRGHFRRRDGPRRQLCAADVPSQRLPGAPRCLASGGRPPYRLPLSWPSQELRCLLAHGVRVSGKVPGNPQCSILIPLISQRKPVPALTLPPVAVETFDGPELVLDKVARDDMGAYLCIASNDIPPAVSKRMVVQVHCECHA